MLSARYEVIQQLSYGLYNVYYRIHDKVIDRLVTLKILRQEKVADLDTCAIFEISARLTARLEHPHIDIIYDLGHYEGRPYLVRRTHKSSIRRLIREQRQISIEEKLRILREVADALDFAHSQRVVHGNIKPTNIQLDERDRAYVLDFMALSKGQDTEFSPDILPYMPLERLQGQALNDQSDVFGLAATAFIFLSGQSPFVGQDVEEHIAARTKPPRLSDFTSEFAPEVSDILWRGLHPDPAQRQQSPSELTSALRAVIREQAPSKKVSVFISYSHKDEDFARQIVDSLQKNQIEVWFDKISLVPGEPWEPSIRKAIKSADKVVVVLSPEAVESDIVQAEIDYAKEKNKPILPLMHRPCEIPLQIRRLQYLDFSQLGYGRGMELLLRGLLA
jgi:serine/threonine protein kinase